MIYYKKSTGLLTCLRGGKGSWCHDENNPKELLEIRWGYENFRDFFKWEGGPENFQALLPKEFLE